MIFKKYIPMKKPIFFRLIIYILIVILFRVEYLVVAFSLGFGSGSGHMWMELMLDGVFFLLNVFSYWVFLHFINPEKKYLELKIVSFLTLIFYILHFIYFYWEA